MPRLSTARYLDLHHRLRRLWGTDAGAFADFAYSEQTALHQFFVPSRDLGDDEMVRYREKVTARFPSLPQRAGRALRSLPAVEREAARRTELGLQAIAHPPLHRPKSQRLPPPWPVSPDRPWGIASGARCPADRSGDRGNGTSSAQG